MSQFIDTTTMHPLETANRDVNGIRIKFEGKTLPIFEIDRKQDPFEILVRQRRPVPLLGIAWMKKVGIDNTRHR